MSANEIPEVFKNILKRLNRPRAAWLQEIEQELINLDPDYLEAHDLLEALVGHLAHQNLTVKGCLGALRAALEEADMEPDGDEPCDIDAFKAKRARDEY